VSAYTHHGECSTLDPCLRCKEFGETQERARIVKVAQLWISEMRGHDSAECNCRHGATILENFINHPEFKGDNK
jgi:hypothetical protein